MATQDINVDHGMWTNLRTAPGTDLERGAWYQLSFRVNTPGSYRDSNGAPTSTIGGHPVSPDTLFAFRVPEEDDVDPWLLLRDSAAVVTVTEAE